MIILDPIVVTDALHTRASQAYFWNSTGKQELAANNQLRMSYDPLDLTKQPLPLVEEEATNLIVYPRNFDHIFWNRIRAFVKPNAAISLDGTMTSDILVEDTTTNNSHFLYQGRTGSNETTTLIFVLEPAGRTQVMVSMSNFVSYSCDCVFDLVAGTFNMLGPNADYTDPKAYTLQLGSGRVLCAFTVTKGSVNTTNTSQLSLLNAAGQNVYTGDGVSGVIVHWAQLVSGSAVTSVIPDSTTFASRAGVKNVFNSNGILVEVPTNTAAYDFSLPAHVSRGLILEAAATNVLLWGDDFSQAPWNTVVPWYTRTRTTDIAAPDGANATNKFVATSFVVESLFLRQTGLTIAAGVRCASIMIYVPSQAGVSSWRINTDYNDADPSVGYFSSTLFDQWVRAEVYTNVTASRTFQDFNLSLPGFTEPPVGFTFYAHFAQNEAGYVATSIIKTMGTAVTRAADVSTSPFATRAADVLGDPAGTLLYNNVPENEYPIWSTGQVWALDSLTIYAHNVYQQLLGTQSAVTISVASPGVITWTGHTRVAGDVVRFTSTGALPTGLTVGTVYYVVSPVTNSFSVAATPGGSAINTTGTQSGVHTCYANSAASLTAVPTASSTYWTLVSPTNARAMFDEANNTQTSNAEEIRLAFTPQSISGGLYLGNLDAASIEVAVVDTLEGVVYSQETSLIQSNSGSSYYNWMFRRIVKASGFIAVDLPAYYDATIVVTIKNPGSIAKCGMCCVGPLLDIGLSQYGLGREIRDYSTTTFDVDGTSSTIKRGYSKVMTVDVDIPNDEVDSVTEALERYSQANVVWIGTVSFKISVVYGTYDSFKTVIDRVAASRMALKINGKV